MMRTLQLQFDVINFKEFLNLIFIKFSIIWIDKNFLLTIMKNSMHQEITTTFGTLLQFICN